MNELEQCQAEIRRLRKLCQSYEMETGLLREEIERLKAECEYCAAKQRVINWLERAVKDCSEEIKSLKTAARSGGRKE